MDKEANKVLQAYKSKFNRLPDQPHHLIAFSKSRSDLPTLNYGKARGAIQAAKSNKNQEGKAKPKGKGKGKPKGKGGEGSKPEKKAKGGEGSNNNKQNNNNNNKKKKKNGKVKDGDKKRVARDSVESPQAAKKKDKDKGGVVSEPMNAKPSQIKALRQQEENDAKAEELPMNEDINDLQIAQQKELPSSPKLNGAVKFPQNVVDNFAPNDEGGGAMAEGGVLSEEEDDDDDDEEFYKDGNETTAPGLLAQMQMQQNNAMAGNDQFDYVTPPGPRQINLDEDEESVVPDDNMSIASAQPLKVQPLKGNPLINDDKLMKDGKNIYHQNRHVNKMMAEMVEQQKLQNGGKLPQQNKRIQSLRDWCFDNGLTEVYEKLVKAGYTTCKMLSKCRDEQIEKIAKDLEFTTPQELTFKVAVEELRTQYLENNYQLRHPEEHRSLTDIINKITESEKLMTGYYGQMQAMHNEIYAYQMDVEREFATIQEELNKRKMKLLNDLNKFFSKKKSIIQMKQQTLTNFIMEAKKQKNEVITMLQDGDVDFTKVDDRKQKIMQIHDDVIVKFLNVKKVQYGLPKANTSFPTTHNLLKEISRFGKVEENIQNTLGVMPVITQLDSNGKDTKIKIKWELTNDHYGIDPDTVKSIRIEWIEVDEEDLQQELQNSIAGMFGGGLGPSQVVSNQAYSQNLGGAKKQNVPSLPGSSLSNPVPGPADRSKSVWNYDLSMQQQDDSKQMERQSVWQPPIQSDNYNRQESNLMNFAVIQPLHPEVQEQQKQKLAKPKKKKLTLDRWMSKHLDFSLYKAINNEHEVNVRKFGKFLVRIKLLGSTQALTSNFVQSNVQSIKVQKMGISYISDKWDLRTKHKDLKVGIVKKKTITRSVPGKWRNCFGSVAVNQGVNIWKLQLKKMDSNRKAFSCMIGVCDSNKAGYMDSNFTEVGGYGMYMNNGNIYHKSKSGKKYYDPNKKGLRPIKNGDIISVIVDYYRGKISFKINKFECGVAFDNINKFINYKLCIALRGCDEISLLDVAEDKSKKNDSKYGALSKNIAGKRMVINKKGNKNYNEAAKYQKQLQEMKLDLEIAVAQDLSLDAAGINAMAQTTGSKSVGDSPNATDYNYKRKSYGINAKMIRKKSQDLFDKIRRHSANSADISNEMKHINIEKNKMKSNGKKKSKHKQSRSFFKSKKKDKAAKEARKAQLKNLADESDEEASVELSKSFDISQLAAIDDEQSIVASSAPSEYNAIAPNVLL